MASEGNEFEAVIREMTLPINGQYPRPWMTRLTDPRAAKVFWFRDNSL